MGNLLDLLSRFLKREEKFRRLFYECLKDGEVPKDWTISSVVPTYRRESEDRI